MLACITNGASVCLCLRGRRSALLRILLSAPSCVFSLLWSLLCHDIFLSSSSSSSSTRFVFSPFTTVRQQMVTLVTSKLSESDVLFFRNYVFQKRFVKFDGKNLMYFGSEKVRPSLFSPSNCYPLMSRTSGCFVISCSAGCLP